MLPNFQLLFESAPGLYLVLTPEFRIVAASDAYLRATMTQRAAVLGRGIFEVFPDNPNDLQATGVSNLRASLERVVLSRVADTMAVQKYDIRRTEAEGGGFEQRYWSPRNSPVLNSNGAVAFIIHQVEDVTEFVGLKMQGKEREALTQQLLTRGEQMEAEVFQRAQQIQEANRQLRETNEELTLLRADLEQRVLERTAEVRASEAKFRSYVENAPVAILVANGEGRYVECNPAATAMLGYDTASLAGMPLLEIHPPEDREHIQRSIETLTREKNVEGEYRMRRRDGRLIWVSLRAVRLPDGQTLGYGQDITERKRNEEAVRDRERLLGIVTGSARVGLVVVGEGYRYLFANEAYAEIFGLNAREIIGRCVADVLATAWAQIQPRLDRALAGEQVTYELKLPPLAGATGPRHFAVVYEPRKGDRGEPTVVVVVVDISERKNAEEALLESEQRLRLLVEGVKDYAIFMLDEHGQIQTWTKEAERICGYSAAEMIGRPSSLLFTKEGIASNLPQDELQQADAHGKINVEGWRVRKDGSRFWATGSLSALYDGAGRVRYFTKIIRDMTEGHRTGQLLQSVLDHTLDGIISIDEHGTVSLFSRSAERIFNYAAAEVIGRNVKMLMPEPYHGEHDGYLTNYLSTGQAKIIGIGREVEGRRKDGSTFPLDLAITEFELEKRRIFLGIVRDISERKALEQQLQQAQKMEAVGQLAGGVAHDFNNLLTIIGGYGEILLDSLPPQDPMVEFVAGIMDAGRRATSLTRQLLAFSRKQVLEPKVLNLNEVVVQTKQMLQRLIGEDILLASTLEPALHPVKVDPGQIEQVLMNLVVNARDAMPQGGRITIETQNVELDSEYVRTHHDCKSGHYVLLSIADTGCGMTAEVQARSFEPFFTTKAPGRGTGLGLATVFGIVKQSEGHIVLYSEVGVGTAFKIYLPAVEQKHVLAPSSTMQEGSKRKGSETILLVEDESGVRKIARLTLEAGGYHVLEAESGQQALDLVAARIGAIDLVLTDVVMPNMSGRQLVEALRGQISSLRVLYMSGYTDDAVVRHGIIQAQNAFLQKPFTPRALLDKVREVLDTKL